MTPDAVGSGGATIELRGVSYRVEAGRGGAGRVEAEHTLIHNLDLTVERGEMLIVLGRSGSGKTTSLRLMNGLLKPSGGDIFIEGRAQQEWDPIRLRRTIGYVMQDVGLFPHWTVARNIGLWCRAWKAGPRRASGSACGKCCGWSAWTPPSSPRDFPVSFPVDSGNAWAWRGRLPPIRRFC